MAAAGEEAVEDGDEGEGMRKEGGKEWGDKGGQEGGRKGGREGWRKRRMGMYNMWVGG